MEQPEGYPSHLPASASATGTGNRVRKAEIAARFSPSPNSGPILISNPSRVSKRRYASSIAWPDIGSSFQKFAAKLLPDENISQAQAGIDVVCQIVRDGLMIISATEMLGMYSLRNIARCDVVDSSVFELWTNNDSSEAQPTRIRLQSDRAGDLLDAVTAAAMELLGFTNWMYLIKYGSEEDDSMGKAVVSVRHGEGPCGQNDLGIKNLVPRARNRKNLMPWAGNSGLSLHDLKIITTGCAPVIPPYNSAATNPEEVYPLGKIIRACEWRYLRDIIELMERGEEVKCYPNGPYLDYVGDSIKSLWGTKDEAGRAKLGCILSFLTYLTEFYRSSRGDNIPPVLLRRFQELFIVPDTGLINCVLIRSYAYVLSLIVEDFRTDGWISHNYGIYGRDGTRSQFELLGCKSIESEEEPMIYYELCTPLKLPKQRIGRGLPKRRISSQPDDTKNIEQVRKWMRDGLGLNEKAQPTRRRGHDGVI